MCNMRPVGPLHRTKNITNTTRLLGRLATPSPIESISFLIVLEARDDAWMMYGGVRGGERGGNK